MSKTAQNILKRLLLLSGGAILLVGCVREDRTECHYPIPLRFTYTYNTEHQDLFDPEVGSLHLFLYDATDGRLVARATPAVNELSPSNGYEWMVAPGTYDLVAWGGVFYRHHYTAPESFSSALLAINRESDGQSVLQTREHVFHAIRRGLRVTGDIIREQVLDLRKNSNDIRVEVSGLSEEQQRQLRCSIRSKNGEYNFDNDCRPTAPLIYKPQISQADGKVIFDMTVLRLWRGDESQLTVEMVSGDGGRSTPIYDGSLTDLLLEKPGTDLDLEDEFTIRFDAKTPPGEDFDFDIYVNDWHVIDMSGGLG